MAKQSKNDPASAWREALTKWETGLNSLANDTMGTDEFSGAMNQAMKYSLAAQKSMGEFMSTYLAAMNLPSRQDVIALGEHLHAMEARIDHMTTLLETLAGAKAPPPVVVPMPPRTKRPPAREPEPGRTP